MSARTINGARIVLNPQRVASHETRESRKIVAKFVTHVGSLLAGRASAVADWQSAGGWSNLKNNAAARSEDF